MLEWVAIAISRGFSRPRDRFPSLLHCRQILYPSEPPVTPCNSLRDPQKPNQTLFFPLYPNLPPPPSLGAKKGARTPTPDHSRRRKREPREARAQPVFKQSNIQEIFPTQGLNPGLPHCRHSSIEVITIYHKISLVSRGTNSSSSIYKVVSVIIAHSTP